MFVYVLLFVAVSGFLIKFLLLNDICKNNKANNTAGAEGFAVLFGFEIYRGRLKKGKNGLFVAKMFLLYCPSVFSDGLCALTYF